MKKIEKTIQVAFTYIGTVVGAGFATGQEILQFFTRYGAAAAVTIALATFLFIWLGTKLMLLAHDIGAKSYEDLNKLLFGERVGRWISFFTMIVLFGVTTVMLAGAGSIFSEHLHLSYQLGLWLTLALTYVVISRGMDGILAVNAVVVPLMLLFTVFIVDGTLESPNAGHWLELPTDQRTGKIWLAPLLYTAFNLAMTQAVLVPLGSAIKDRSVIVYGGLLGGAGIGLMLLAGHFALSAQMPGIARFEIPMGTIVHQLGREMQLLFLLVIFAEIFTTFIADVYGLALQLEQRLHIRQKPIVICILALCYAVSQIGFSTLLSTLYPIFGCISLFWLGFLVIRRKAIE